MIQVRLCYTFIEEDVLQVSRIRAPSWRWNAGPVTSAGAPRGGVSLVVFSEG